MSDQLPTGSTINGSSGAKFGSCDPARGWAGKRRAGELPPKSAHRPFSPSTIGKTSNASVYTLTACRGALPPDP